MKTPQPTPHKLPTPNPLYQPLSPTYRALLVDPPWSKNQRGGKYGAGKYYDLMTDAELLGMSQAVRDISLPDSYLFMWITSAVFEFAPKLMRAWGFEYKTFQFWAKLGHLGLGRIYRNSGELLLVGVRGKPELHYKSEPNLNIFPRLQHSRKPTEAHHVVERLVGPGPYLEMFARRPSPSSTEGWSVWGNEIDSDICLADYGYPVPGDEKFLLEQGK